MPAKRSKRASPDDLSSSASSVGGTSLQPSPSGSGLSPDAVRETVKEKVGLGVAAVAGVADGINEQMEQTGLKDTAEQAVRQVGETAHKVVRAAREETDNIRSAVKGESSQQQPSLGYQGEESGLASGSSTLEGSSYGSGAGTFAGASMGTGEESGSGLLGAEEEEEE